MGNDTPAGSPADSVDADIEAILTGTSGDQPDTSSAGTPSVTTPTQADTPAQAAVPSNQQPQSLKLGGREYKSLQEADKAHRTLYGKFSEGQQMLNWFKANLKNPAVLQQLANNPEWGPIAAKLGLQQAQEELEQEEEAEDDGSEPVIDRMKLPPQVRPIYDKLEHQRQEFEVWRNTVELKEEMREYEGELKRKITPEERKSVLDIIERAPTLTFREAWTIANHDKDMKALASKYQTQAQAKDQAKRPRPIPGVKVPGTSVDMKKDPLKMGQSEWREYLKNQPEFQKLVERG